MRLLTSGAGHRGYCKLCSFDDPKLQDAFDKRVLDYSTPKLNEWLDSKGLIQSDADGRKKLIDRGTVYKHRDHVRDPKDRMVSAVAKRQLEHGSLPATVSEQEFLDAVIAMGHARAQANPEAVTIDHALKATQIKAQSKSQGSAHQMLVQIFTGRMPAEATVIEGEFHES